MARSRFRKAVRKVIERCREKHFIQLTGGGGTQPDRYWLDTLVPNYPGYYAKILTDANSLPLQGIGDNQFTGNEFQFQGWQVHGSLYVDATTVADGSARLHVFKIPRINGTGAGFYPAGAQQIPQPYGIFGSCVPGNTANPVAYTWNVCDSTYDSLYIDANARRNPFFARGQPIHQFFKKVATYTLDARRAEGSFHNYVKTFKFWIPYKRSVRNATTTNIPNMVDDVFPDNDIFVVLEGSQIGVADSTAAAQGASYTGIRCTLAVRAHFTDM